MHTASMRLTAAVLIVLALARAETRAPRHHGPAVYTDDGRLKLPEDYREWVYLSSGFDMSYNRDTGAGNRHSFDNVFANPEAYRSFLEKGSWPDGTTLVLEIRDAQQKGSINQSGSFQSGVAAVEVHVKDEGRFPGRWAFFGFDSGSKVSKMIPKTADCYSCHQEHGAVDTTFVQFYPTLMPIAKSKGTLSAAYRSGAGLGEVK